MGVFKGLFVGVYASSPAIRVLFLPLCYLLLSTPFALVLARYFRFDSWIKNKLFEEKSLTDLALQGFVLLVAALLPTRIISARGTGKAQDGKRRVQSLPYWIPGVRNWGNVVFGGEGWLRGVRDSCVTPIAAYNIAGSRHSLVFSPQLLDQLLAGDDLDTANLTKWAVIRNAFSMPASMKQGYLDLLPEIVRTKTEIFGGPKSVKLLAASLSNIAETLPDLITFNSSIVDQMQWERVANLELTDGTVEAECDLFALINEAFCAAIISPITGPAFPESYLLLPSDLQAFNQCYYALALGLPRLWPLPGLPGAMLAKRRLLSNFERLFDELTNPPQKKVPNDDESMSGEETDADTPTPFTGLNDLFTKHNVPIQARAAIALHLLHGLYAELVPIAFWTILHIHHAAASGTSQSLVESILREIGNWAVAVQPPSIHPSFPAPPEISFSYTSQPIPHDRFPLLRSCINEARRLYNSSVETLKITKSISITDPDSLRPGKPEEWILDANSYIDVGQSCSLINTSSANFLSANTYQPDRFVNSPPPSSVTASSFGHRKLTEVLLLGFVGGMLQLWVISAAPKKSFRDHMQEAQAAATGEKKPAASREPGTWIVPRAEDGSVVKVPKGDVRIRIRRREGLPARNVAKGRV